MKALIGPNIKFFVDRFWNRFDRNPLNHREAVVRNGEQSRDFLKGIACSLIIEPHPVPPEGRASAV
jgi:hypothetical protein